MTEKKKVIIFIDGNNFYHNLKASFLSPGDLSLKKVSDLVANHFNFELKRTIYYNSVPSIDDGKSIYYSHMKFLNEVKSFPGFKVKIRKLQRLSTKERLQLVQKEVSSLGLCKTCTPIVNSHWKDYLGSISVKEKGIDTMMCIDMLNLSLIDKECDACILISGDADFVPAMELMHSKNVWVGSASLAKGYSYELRNKFPWFILDKDWIKKNCLKK